MDRQLRCEEIEEVGVGVEVGVKHLRTPLSKSSLNKREPTCLLNKTWHVRLWIPGSVLHRYSGFALVNLHFYVDRRRLQEADSFSKWCGGSSVL